MSVSIDLKRFNASELLNGEFLNGEFLLETKKAVSYRAVKVVKLFGSHVRESRTVHFFYLNRNYAQINTGSWNYLRFCVHSVKFFLKVVELRVKNKILY